MQIYPLKKALVHIFFRSEASLTDFFVRRLESIAPRSTCYMVHTFLSNKLSSEIRFSPDGQWIASGGEDGAVKVWDLRAGKLMNDLDDQSGGVNDVEFHPHEFLLAAANQNKTISFWDLEKVLLSCI